MSIAAGVYLGRNEVIAVSTVRSVSGPQIKSFAIEPILAEAAPEAPAGNETHKIKNLSPEARAIRKALERIHAPGAFVNVAVSPSQVVTRHFIMPSVPKKDFAGAVRHEASRYIPFKISDSVLDYHARLTHKNVFSITATAIRTEILETCLDDLRSVSAKTLMVEPVYSAVGRAFGALNMLGKSNTHGFVMLQSDGNVNVTLASKGIVYLSRDFLLTGNIDQDKERFYDELKASMDYFYKLSGGEAIEQIFLSGAGELKAWSDHLGPRFGNTIRFDVARMPNAKDIPQETLSVLLTAFGLSLRALGYASPLGDIKLLPKENRRSGPQQLLIFLGLECLVILILFGMIRFAIFQPYLMHLVSQREAILDPVRQEDPAFAAKSFDDLTQEKAMAVGRLKKLRSFFSDTVPAAGFLKALGQGLPKSILLDNVSLKGDSGKENALGVKGKKRLSMSGFCFLGNAEKETLIVSSWVKALAGKKAISSYFGEIKLEEIKREKIQSRDLTRFRIAGE